MLPMVTTCQDGGGGTTQWWRPWSRGAPRPGHELLTAVTIVTPDTTSGIRTTCTQISVFIPLDCSALRAAPEPQAQLLIDDRLPRQVPEDCLL